MSVGDDSHHSSLLLRAVRSSETSASVVAGKKKGGGGNSKRRSESRMAMALCSEPLSLRLEDSVCVCGSGLFVLDNGSGAALSSQTTARAGFLFLFFPPPPTPHHGPRSRLKYPVSAQLPALFLLHNRGPQAPSHHRDSSPSLFYPSNYTDPEARADAVGVWKSK